MLEVERKFLHADFQLLRARLAGLGAVCEGMHFESNLLFDTPEQSLWKRGDLLRLRIRQWPDKKDCVLTFKSSKIPVPECPKNKIRSEWETRVSNADMTKEILLRLGLAPCARYEKLREEWSLEIPDLPPGDNIYKNIYKVDLDEVSFGKVCEVEGPLASLDRVVELLNLSDQESSTLSYHDLHRQWRKANGLPEIADLVFSPQQLQTIRNNLGLPISE